MTVETPLRAWRDRAKSYAERLGHQIGDFITDHYQAQPAQRLLCVCLKCGGRVIVVFDARALQDGAEDAVSIEGAATFFECRPDALCALESKAWLLGESPTLLETRLRRAIEELVFEDQERFDPGEFQPQRKRWLSDDGMLALQWQLRELPQWPISPDNRQNAWGIVEFSHIVREADLMPALYRGEYLNPNLDASGNPDADEENWWCDPLESNETGFAYRDDDERWRFKRKNGTTGFFVNRSDIVFQRLWLDFDETEQSAESNPNDPQQYP